MFDPATFAVGLVGISLILWGLRRRVDAIICIVFAIIFALVALR